jgi:hypothetical protein
VVPTTGFIIDGVAAGDGAGAVSDAGDVNGDGIDDVIIGASGADPEGRVDAGASYVVFGRHVDDAVPDDLDNCTLVSNSTQLGVDADGIGNAWDGDFDNNCIVRFADLRAFRSVLVQTGLLEEDIDGDHIVDLADYEQLRALFFRPPGPSGVPSVCD